MTFGGGFPVTSRNLGLYQLEKASNVSAAQPFKIKAYLQLNIIMYLKGKRDGRDEHIKEYGTGGKGINRPESRSAQFGFQRTDRLSQFLKGLAHLQRFHFCTALTYTRRWL